MGDFPSFFTNVDRIDRRPDKEPASPFPAWYFENKQSELEMSISQMENQIKLGLVNPESMMNMKQEVSKLRLRLGEIRASKIKLTTKQEDALNNFRKKAGELLRDSMPTRSAMQKGLANAHTEMKLNTEPKFGVSGYEDVLRAMNIKIKNGKVSRNELAIAWKIASKYFNEESNVEYLRKDVNTGMYHLDKSLEELERGE